jgi:hypothetical protein
MTSRAVHLHPTAPASAYCVLEGLDGLGFVGDGIVGDGVVGVVEGMRRSAVVSGGLAPVSAVRGPLVPKAKNATIKATTTIPATHPQVGTPRSSAGYAPVRSLSGRLNGS